ncbi:hypothetical protein HZF05_09990 [Sphingomonas sp. CGMCC 1.13654]|uniref:Uncharacterized protein n=1 Tax=Sphingomonas chungangi TaxID=2683589 RepID=A0A838LAA2_9SPHN|nr:hypothetical protein [Sphingomonas chungangi]MBA2934428.1 hypothetical protein [Sphingomonas chungangi]MVW57467.1 hypothetical protein [Sphingomonas chungangi]
MEVPASPYVIALRDALGGSGDPPVERFRVGSMTGEILSADNSLWVVIRRGRDEGGVALRAAFIPMAFTWKVVRRRSGETVRLRVTSAMGVHEIAIRAGGDGLEHVRMTVALTPAVPTLIPFMPRDLYPLGKDDDPLAALGIVEAAQRGLNCGIVYFHVDTPAFGNVLYFQNLTAMNDYYRATRTSPDGAVGGRWPELGYLLPAPAQSGRPPADPLPAGVEVTLSDAILVFRHHVAPHERESARQFLQMLGEAYKLLDLPATQYRDWVARAERTLSDLDEAPEATIRHYGCRYIHPYTASEYPDSMVQISVLAAIFDWGRWRGEPHPLEAELRRGLRRFYDPKLKALRRYLPNVGKDKDADAVDSWYLYHPVLNLGRMALAGDRVSRRLFLDSIDFCIEAARHFDYRWPIQYKVTDFSVITATANDDRGQTDVGGLYAYVMLQAHELTGEPRFLDEAKAAIRTAIGMRFNLNYQANLTAWGAAACMRLYRISDDVVFAEQSYVYLASFFHNTEIWESRLEHAVHYKNFLGATCLQDAPYMAVYECFDAFTAFEVYLDQSGPDLDPAVRMLVAEYCKYALDRAWYYYPDALPAEILATDNRNGHIDRARSFPLEDLYPDGQCAGQVGQEIYGAGAAMVFSTRSFHPVSGAPFRLFCDHFIRGSERIGDRSLSLVLDGGETCVATLSVVGDARRKLPRLTVVTAGGDAVRGHPCGKGRVDFHPPASGRLIISWSE